MKKSILLLSLSVAFAANSFGQFLGGGGGSLNLGGGLTTGGATSGGDMGPTVRARAMAEKLVRGLEFSGGRWVVAN